MSAALGIPSLSIPSLSRYYYVFGFLLVVLLILIVTCAEITIVMCYFQLCAEVRWHYAVAGLGSCAIAIPPQPCRRQSPRLCDKPPR